MPAQEGGGPIAIVAEQRRSGQQHEEQEANP